jgi:hypothetical protein
MNSEPDSLPEQVEPVIDPVEGAIVDEQPSDTGLEEGQMSTQEPEADWVRLQRLTRTIELYPDTPSNYVLRGELLIDAGYNDKAADDFQKAIELSEAQAESADWGYIHRALIDRAIEGLKRTSRS